MTGDLLRRAADTLREHAAGATDPLTLGEPWQVVDDDESDTTEVHAVHRNLTSVIAQEVLSPQHGAYIALLHPPVAEALADLFDNAVDIIAGAEGTGEQVDYTDAEPLLKLARVVLREDG